MKVTKLLVFAALSFACGGAAGDSSSVNEPPPECPSGNCGKQSFRQAIPTKKTVAIDFAGRTSQRLSSRTATREGIGSRRLALESVSPVFTDLTEYVEDINGTIEVIFDDLEEVAGTVPEQEEDALHVWRAVDDDDSSLDRVLVMSSEDEVNFDLLYFLGPNGFQPDEDSAIMAGTITMADDTKAEFSLSIDFSAIAAIVTDIDATGTLSISAMPFAGGQREVWYDFRGFSIGAESPEDSITTYWLFGEGDGALEYLASIDDEDVTVFARWNDRGGRYDHHASYVDDELGLIDDIATNCWDTLAAEVFSGEALLDQELSYYGELDGDEAECEFGPVDGHPNPGEEFDNLPAEGEWDDLEMNALEEEECENPLDPECEEEEEEAPLCQDEPFDPDCIPFCEDAPFDPDCVDYCDVVDDPLECF